MRPNRSPRWKPPGHYGYAAAIESMGAIAAPFLAGIGIALAVLVISSANDFAWANGALFALVVSTAAFIACLECTFIARQYVATPGMIEEWWPDPDEADIQRMEDEQADLKGKSDRWSGRARWAYNAGIIAFSFGVVCVLAPKPGANDGRLSIFALAWLAFAAELVSVARPNWRDWRDWLCARRWVARVRASLADSPPRD